MEKKDKIKVAGLCLLGLLATGVSIGGAYAATAQAVQFKGDVSYIANAHVDAEIECLIDDVKIDLNGSDAGTALIVKKEDASNKEYVTSAFNSAFAAAFQGNTGADGGYVVPKSSVKVGFEVKNVSALGYKLNVAITHSESSLVNIQIVENDASYSNKLDPNASLAGSYNISVVDETKSASGSFNWNIALSAE